MNRMFNLIIILIIFLFGIQIGTLYVENYTNTDLFEITKDEFEENITKPNNEYNPKQLTIKKNILNKIADKIENIIDKIAKKIT